jgi:hypothetical protein
VPETLSMFHQIARKGWQSLPLERGWQLKHPDIKGAVYVNVTEQWISIIYPLDAAQMLTTRSNPQQAEAELPAEHEENQPNQSQLDLVRGYRSLLKQNERMFMAKFCLDEDAHPLLMVEISAKCSQRILLERALDALIHYANAFSSEENAPLLTREAYALPDETPGMPRETIFRYIKGVEVAHWGLKKEPGRSGQSWHIGHQGHFRVFDVYLTLTKNWAYFQIPVLPDRIPSVLMAEDTRLRALFFKYLLQLNALWFMARLSISADSYLLILLEIPTEALDFTLFQLATSTLAIYLDRYEQELQIMASLENDQELIELLSKKI